MAYPMPAKPSKPEIPGVNRPASGNQGWLKGLLTLVLVLIIVGGGIYLILNYTDLGKVGQATNLEMDFSADWQAVFLTNGQVYFGKVAAVDENFVNLEDIYYLQVVTMQDSLAQPPDVQTQPEQRLTLIKLGNEIHGPKDSMKINTFHVVLIEDLKDDSRVVQAIDDYLKSGGGDAAAQ